MTSLDPAYKYHEGYITLTLPPPPHLPSSLILGDRHYVVKPEFHTSIVAVKLLVADIIERDHISEDEAEKRASEVAIAAVNRTKPTFIGYLNDVRLADKDPGDRHTVVVMASVTGLVDVFAEINHELELSRPVQQAHATLYTAENRKTIGITSPAELSERTRALDPATRAELTSQLDPYKTFAWSMFMSPAPIRNNLILELHVPSFGPAREFYEKFGFTQVDYDPISGGGTSDLGYFELKREDSLGRAQLNLYGDKASVAEHARFNEFPADTPRGYAVEITFPVDDVEGLWGRVGRHLPKHQISEPLQVKRWGKRDFRVIDPFGFYIRFTEPVDWRQDV
jgi:uncharacterized glyoxalase superfamily protein PhnB